MIKTLNIGVGLGGGKFAAQLSKKLSIAGSKEVGEIFINISSDELNVFGESTKVSEKILVGDSDGGAGKNRDIAIKAFTERFNVIDFLNKIKSRVIEEKIDLINVCFSTGGGSGSGISPFLIQALYQSIEKDSKTIGHTVLVMGIGLLPSHNEGVGVFRNTMLNINDMNKGILAGCRYMLIKNSGREGSNFVEKRDYVNEYSTRLITDYLRGTTDTSINGVLDLSDRRLGLSFPGLHGIARLKDCEVQDSPFILPGSSICKSMMCEIPDENADMYENNLTNGSVNLDFKFGYTTSDEGIVAFHGYNNLQKETVSYRKRFEDLKKMDLAGNLDTGADSLSSLKSSVYHYNPASLNTGDSAAKDIKDIQDLMKMYTSV